MLQYSTRNEALVNGNALANLTNGLFWQANHQFGDLHDGPERPEWCTSKVLLAKKWWDAHDLLGLPTCYTTKLITNRHVQRS